MSGPGQDAPVTTPEDLDEMGERLKERKEELMAKMGKMRAN